MKNTKIEWCDDTANPTMGCAGCELWNPKTKACYAGHSTEKHAGQAGFPKDFNVPELFPGRMSKAALWPDLIGTTRPDKPWLDGLARCIFVSDMGDALSPTIQFDYLLGEIIDVTRSEKGQRHNWPWLTKQPKRMAEFSDWLQSQGITWPKSLWAMTSVTSQSTATARIPHLLEVGDGNTIHGLSVEPLLEQVTLEKWLPQLDWVIVGGESGDQPRKMNLDWARALRDECKAAGVPYFFKQIGGRSFDKGGDLSLIPADLRVRQMPSRARFAPMKEQLEMFAV